jgi:hypothetical protein
MAVRRPLQTSVASLAALGWSLAALAADNPPAFPGTYANAFGTVAIKQTAEGFDVEISTAEPSRGLWECDFSGSGKLNSDHAIVIDYRPESGADTATDKVTLTLKNNVVRVTETRSAQFVDFCGFRGFIGGNYRRKVKR